MFSKISHCYCKISRFKDNSCTVHLVRTVLLVYNVAIVYGGYMLARTLVVYYICSLRTYIYYLV